MNEKNPPLIGPKRGLIRNITVCCVFVLYKFGFYTTCFGFFPGVLEGSGSSGRLVGTISTYPGTCKCPWSRVIAKNPGVDLFLLSTVYRAFEGAIQGYVEPCRFLFVAYRSLLALWP